MAEQTCNRGSTPGAPQKCQLFSGISEFEPLIGNLENGVQVLFALLTTPDPTINRKAVDFMADMMNLAVVDLKDHWEKLYQKAAGRGATEDREDAA